MMLSPALMLALPMLAVEPFLRDPDIHGNTVAFSCEGDIWIGDLQSGKAARLTRGEGTEQYPRFSPDGTQIAFSAQYDGMMEVYVMPVSGGTPTRVSYHCDYAWLLDWTPDGKSIYYRGRSVPRSFGVFVVPVSGGFSTRLPIEFASHLSFAPDGNRFIMTRIFRADEAWFHYQGGRKNDLWTGDVAAKSFKKIRSTKWGNEFPLWVGNRVAFASDEDGKFSIYVSDPDGTDTKRLAGPYDVEIRNLQSDGSRVIYQRGNTLEVVAIAGGAPNRVNMSLASDMIHTIEYNLAAEDWVDGVTVGPTGKRILAECRGQIVSLPTKDGDARVLMSKPGARLRRAVWSPDGKKIAYISDETHEQQVMTCDAGGTNPKQLTSDSGRSLYVVEWSPDSQNLLFKDSLGKLRMVTVSSGRETVVAQLPGYGAGDYSFSPDSKWISYMAVDLINDYRQIMLYEVASGKATRVSDGFSQDSVARFSNDGNFLVFISARNTAVAWDYFLNQMNNRNPMKIYLLALRADVKSPFLVQADEEGGESKADVKSGTGIDLSGLYTRQIDVPVPPDNYNNVAMVDGRIIFSNGTVIGFYDTKAKRAGVVTEGGAFEVSADNKKLMVVGPNARIMDVTAQDSPAGVGRVSYGNLQLTIQPKEEWTQIYWECWRLIRDYFYVENLHGADWPAIAKKYEAMLPSVRSRSELTELIRWLQSETNVGHMYRNDGDTKSLQKVAAPAFLGLDLEADASGYYKIKTIFRGDGFSATEVSPFAMPGIGVKEGDYLISVAGVPARAGVNFMRALANRAGQTVEVKTNTSASSSGAKSVFIKPIPDERPLRYREWVKQNREYVSKKSGGKLGYIHLSAMTQNDMSDFIKQYFAQRDKDALVVDVRFNGGGSTSTAMINILKQKVVAYFNERGNPYYWTRQGDFFLGPMVCLMNEFSASCGEEFPHHFQALKLGPLIGRRTWGGEVGSDPAWPLIDGGTMNVARYGAWTPKDGWIIEGTGMSPDIDVESDPNAFARGVDMQLDKGIEYLLDSLKKNPVVRPVPPPAQNRMKSGGG